MSSYKNSEIKKAGDTNRITCFFCVLYGDVNMHILRADQGHNVLLYSGIHLTGKLDELLRIFLIRREQLSCLGIIGGFLKVFVEIQSAITVYRDT